jgi:KDO2-lipid IV(A) lauroyltransferase
MRLTFFRLISRLPFRILYVISDILAFVAGNIIGYRKKVILKNLENAFPQKTGDEIKLLLPAIYKNLTDVMVETFKLLSIPEEELLQRVRFKNIEVIDQYYYQNISVIAATSHICNWEWILAACSIKLSAPVDAVYQEITSRFFERLMFRIRSRFGSIPVEKNNIFRESLKKRNIPHIVALVADQSPPLSDTNVYWTEFLNQDTVFYSGMERLASSFKWPVVYASMTRLKRGYYEIDFIELEIEPENIPKGLIIEKYVTIVEDLIINNPGNWLWSHNRWKRKKTISGQDQPARNI